LLGALERASWYGRGQGFDFPQVHQRDSTSALRGVFLRVARRERIQAANVYVALPRRDLFHALEVGRSPIPFSSTGQLEHQKPVPASMDPQGAAFAVVLGGRLPDRQCPDDGESAMLLGSTPTASLVAPGSRMPLFSCWRKLTAPRAWCKCRHSTVTSRVLESYFTGARRRSSRVLNGSRLINVNRPECVAAPSQRPWNVLGPVDEISSPRSRSSARGMSRPTMYDVVIALRLRGFGARHTLLWSH
jgi:hypothetical protein